MKSLNLNIENIKCHGCANTIRHELSKYPEVRNVKVNPDEGNVSIDYEADEEMKDLFTGKLAKLGYPEKGDKNLKSRVRSYVSCAIGRMK